MNINEPPPPLTAPPLLPIHTHKHTKPSYFAIISSKNKMIMISSAQMSQPNGCESLGKDNIQLTKYIVLSWPTYRERRAK